MPLFKRKTRAAPAAPQATSADELPFWRRKTMREMTREEWESLCDGCGRCCLNKLYEEGTEKLYYTDVGCRLLDGEDLPLHRLQEPRRQGFRLRHADQPQYQPHQLAAADLRLQAGRRGEGPLLVAPAGLRRPGHGARRRRLGAR